jgi:Rrf2 family protein
MLQLTKRTEYGLIALVAMVGRRDEYVSAREISEHYKVPRRLLAEVLKDLSRASLVESQRGATGGYALARSADEISVAEVVAALEGAPSLAGCEKLSPAHGSECELEDGCPIRSPLQVIREGISALMENTSLRTLVRSTLRLPTEHFETEPTRHPAPGGTLPS